MYAKSSAATSVRGTGAGAAPSRSSNVTESGPLRSVTTNAGRQLATILARRLAGFDGATGTYAAPIRSAACITATASGLFAAQSTTRSPGRTPYPHIAEAYR